MTLPPFVMAGAEPYFARGGATGVLVLHGFTATPHEVRWLAAHLAEDGHTVYAPRIAGHGTDYRDLARTRWQDWAATALDGVSVLRAQCDRVCVVGLSMGGTLALLTAAATRVDAVGALAAPISGFAGMSPARLRILRRLKPFTDQTDRSAFVDYLISEQRALGESILGRVRYDLWATAGVEQLLLLMDEARRNLPRITAPVLAVYSRSDATVQPTHLDTLTAGLNRAVPVETHVLERSSHILTQDVERETVFGLVSEFVGRCPKPREGT